MPSVSAAAGTQQQLRLEAEPVATTFSAADTTAFLQGSWKEAMERGAVRCIIAETAPNHEEEHKDWEAMIEAARQRNLDEEVPPPSSKPTNYWDRLPDELQDIIMRRARRLVIKRQIFVKGLTGQTITMSDVRWCCPTRSGSSRSRLLRRLASHLPTFASSSGAGSSRTACSFRGTACARRRR